MKDKINVDRKLVIIIMTRHDQRREGTFKQ